MLLSIGDSFTYGQELANREVDAWPYVLARKLNLGVDNSAVPAGSNDRTFRFAVNGCLSNKYKLIVCGWTEVSRIDTSVNGKELQITSGSTWLHKKMPWVKEYYANHYDERLAQESWLSKLITLQELFKSRKQKYLFVSMDSRWDWDEYYHKLELMHLVEQIDKNNYVGWPEEGFTHWQGEAPLGPNGHPLELGHQRIADKIYEHIRNKQWFS
jgi:hypothetical protein